MVTASSPPGAVEGEKILVRGQAIKPDGFPIPISNSGDLLFPLRVDKRGEAIITKEKTDKVARFKPYSMLQLNDKISGKWLYGFNSDPIKKIIIGGGGRTGRHSGQELELEGICFMEIVRGWNNTCLPEHPKDELIRRINM